MDIVLDTNILLAGLRSCNGSSHKLLELIRNGHPAVRYHLSASVVLEYEEILTRELVSSTYSSDEISSFLDDFVANGIRHASITSLRPVSIDPDDDALIELAVTAAADTFITFNTRHLKFAYAHGINLLTPGGFLRKLNL